MDARHRYGGMIIALGAVLGVLQVVDGIGGDSTTRGLVLNVAPFVLISAAIAFTGYWVMRQPTLDAHAARIAGWCAGGGVLFGAVSVLASIGGGVGPAGLGWPAVIADNASAGVLVGALVGLYDAERRNKLAEVEAKRDRIEEFAAEAASLNRYGKVLNQSTSVEEVSALCIEAVEVLIGRSGAAFVVVGNGEAWVVDETLGNESPDRVLGVAHEVATSDEIEAERYETDDGNGLLAIPIPAGATVTGVLLARPETGNGHETGEIDLLELLAAHASTALYHIPVEAGEGGKRPDTNDLHEPPS